MNSLDTFLFEAMKETHEQHKTKIDIDELITGLTNINFLRKNSSYTCFFWNPLVMASTATTYEFS